jgi:hypothetical protein
VGRPLRVESTGALYQITSRRNEKRATFLKKMDRRRFLFVLEEWEEYRGRYRMLIDCFGLMTLLISSSLTVIKGATAALSS